MALSARDLLLVLRAQDMVSGTLASIGGQLNSLNSTTLSTQQRLANTGFALSSIGGIMTLAGGAGVNFFNSATNAATDWSKEAALAATQSQRVGVSLDQIKEIGRAVGRDVPVALDQINPALYDIFSTVNTDAPGAKNLLTQFSKAAVAGNVDIQDSARLTMAIMNAYQLPIEDVTKVLDSQFRLVELGTGTYGEFATSIGRAIPSAVSAGQSFGDLAGMMAFLTKNGLSTQMAATSTARALDTIATPKAVRNLEAYGVSVKDANGNFRSMSDIITQLAVNKGWAQMTDPDRKKAFTEIFGTGTAQARRFFDVAIPNYETFNSLTEQVKNSSGAMQGAYDIMFNEPATKAQLLSNKYALLKQEIGEQLIPAKIKLMETIGSLIDKWNSLDEGTRKIIVTVLAVISAVLAVVGPILIVAGSVLLFISVLSSLGVTIGAAVTFFGWFLLIVAAVAAAAFLIYKNWDTVGPLFKKVFDLIKDNWEAAVLAFLALTPIFSGLVIAIAALALLIYKNWDTIGPLFEKVWNTAKNAISDAWAFIQPILSAMADFFVNEVWPRIVDGAQFAWDKLTAFWDWLTNSAVPAIVSFAQSVWDGFQFLWDKAQEVWGWFESTFGPGFQRIWDSLKENIPPIIEEIKETWDSLVAKAQEIYDLIAPIIGALVTYISDEFNKMKEAIQIVWDWISPYVTPILDALKANIGEWIDWVNENWRILWDAVKTQVEIVWNLISTIISSAIAIISNNIQLFLNILQGDWGEAWNNIVNILKAIWEIIKAVIGAAIATLINTIGSGMAVIGNTISTAWNMLVNLTRAAFGQLVSTISSAISQAISFIRSLPAQIQSVFSGAAGWLVNAGRNIIQGLINGINSRIQAVKSALSSITGLIPSWKGPESVDKRLLFGSGQMIMGGLQVGLADGWGNVRSYLNGLTTAANFAPAVSVETNSRLMGADDSNVVAALTKIVDTDTGNSDRLLEAIERLIEVVQDNSERPQVVMSGSTPYWYNSENSGA